jgi:uncharacterized repeat protein (TIGR01451 family)
MGIFSIKKRAKYIAENSSNIPSLPCAKVQEYLSRKHPQLPNNYALLGFAIIVIFVVLSLVDLEFAQASDQDGYFYSNNFTDALGINNSQTQGFTNMGGYYEATLQDAVITSTCISLPQSENSGFDEWSFLEIELSHLDDVDVNSLTIEDCAGNELLATPFTNISSGVTSFDISSISSSEIVLKYNVEHNGVIPSTTLPSRLVEWAVYGKSTGITNLTVVPNTTSVDSGETVTFNLEVSSSIATTVSPVLEIDLESLNGDGLTVGTSEDSTVCYDTDGSGVAGDDPTAECQMYRPLELVSVGNGPNGEVATHPGIGSTQGTITWNLQSIPYGTSINIPVTFRVPKGYIKGKYFYLQASLTHGESSANGLLDNYMVVTADSSNNKTYVNSVESTFNVYSPFGAVGAETENIRDSCYNNDNRNAHPSDVEHVTVKVYNTGSCDVGYNSVSLSNVSNNTSRIVAEPAVGANITDTDPVEVRVFRAKFLRSSARFHLRYDVGSTVPSQSDCVDGEGIRMVYEFAHKESNYTRTRTHNIRTTICRNGTSRYVHRLQAGLYTGSYSMTPGWTEYYLTNGKASMKPGEYYLSWGFYGNAGYRTHTVTLQKSYYIVEIPEYSSFHGVRGSSGSIPEMSVYKDVSGTAPLPGEPGFDINFNEYDANVSDTPNPAWYPVRHDWPGTPFTDTLSATNPEAVITGTANERLLIVKYNDDPPGTGNQGNFTPLFLWKVCDGAYCPQPSQGVQGRVNEGKIYTQYEDAVYDCHTKNGQTIVYENASWPAIYLDSAQSAYPAGSSVNLTITPHNHNRASEYVDGVWGINLFNIRDYINFDNIVGNITGPSSSYPRANQNLAGESCDISQATLNVPDETTCLNSTDGSSADCYVYWDIPDACQVPNGWGYNIPGTSYQDNYNDAYKINLNIPVHSNVPAGTTLSFDAEVRKNNLSELGADNVVSTSSWSANNYEDSVVAEITENPAIEGSQTAPTQWSSGETMTYNLSAKNIGNAPNKGVYIVDSLPRVGINNSSFTPTYGKFYSTLAPTDAVYLYSEDNNCFSNIFDPAVNWTELASGSTTRDGYNSESAVIPSTAICVQVHIDDTSTFQPQPGESIEYAFDVDIPGSVVDGEVIYNRAKVGLSELYGSSSSIAPIDINVANTEVGDTLILGLSTSFEIDKDRAGFVLWTIDYQNLSSATAQDVLISDIIPANMIFDSVVGDSIGQHEECAATGCEPSSVNPDNTGGTLQFDITELDPFDGNTGGTDEGQIQFWTKLYDLSSTNEIVENCATITPSAAGIGASGCTSFTTTSIEGAINIAASSNQGGNPIFIRKDPWGYGTFTIELENSLSNAVYFNVHDELPPEIEYVPGSLKINSLTASDTLVDNNILHLESPDSTSPGENYTVSFDFTIVNSVASGSHIANEALISYCTNPLDSMSCVPARSTDNVEFVVFNEEPILNEDSVETVENNNITFNVLDNDTEPDDRFDLSTLSFTDVENGVLVNLGNNGEFRYEPQTDFFGSDSFTYEICDMGTPVKCASSTVDIEIQKGNRPPVIQDDYIGLDQDTSISFTVHEDDYDDEGSVDLSTLRVFTEPMHGVVTYDSSNYLFTYTPEEMYSGADEFEYEICDNQGACAIGTVYVTVDWVNQPPTVVNDVFEISQTSYIDVLANDEDIDDGLDVSSFQVVEEPSKGDVTFDIEKKRVLYTVHFSNESYLDTFTYEICDLSGECDQGEVTVQFYDFLAQTGRNILPYIVGAISVLISFFYISQKRQKQ